MVAALVIEERSELDGSVEPDEAARDLWKEVGRRGVEHALTQLGRIHEQKLKAEGFIEPLATEKP